MTRIRAILVLVAGCTCMGQSSPESRQLERLKELQQRQTFNSSRSGKPTGEVGSDLQTPEQAMVSFESALASNGMDIPFQGRGGLQVFGDGTIIVEFSGQETLNAASGEIELGPSLTMAFKVGTAGLSVVEARGEYFLDRNGTQSSLRGLVLDTLNVKRFATEDSSSKDETLPLLSLSGPLSVSLDRSQDQVTIGITGERNETSFVLPARLVSSVSGDSGGVASSGNAIDTQYIPDFVFTSGCNACCGSQGQYCCSIECPKKCQAGCHGDTPFCECTGIIF